MDAPLDFAVRTAKQAGELLQGYFRQGSLHARLKSDHSVVTEADLAADRLIEQTIHEAYPHDVLLSEELQPGFQPNAGETVWIIDPLDGTTNFSLGLQIWGVSIARVVEGYTDIAAIYFPMLGEMYTAQRGLGAYMNGERLALGTGAQPKPASFFSCCSRTFRHYQVSVPYKARILGSAAYSFCTLCRGAALVVFDATPKIWDIAGVWLVVEEAGGIIETYDGIRPFPLRPGVVYERQVFTTIAAATPELVSRARRQIRPKTQKQER
jgi:myo-inositol-1(or 4)-monophosphatase